MNTAYLNMKAYIECQIEFIYKCNVITTHTYLDIQAILSNPNFNNLSIKMINDRLKVDYPNAEPLF